MGETTYAADATFANDTDFLEWIAELEKVIQDWDAKHGDISPYTMPLSKSTGLECWRQYYDDETTPEDAFAEDRTSWGK